MEWWQRTSRSLLVGGSGKLIIKVEDLDPYLVGTDQGSAGGTSGCTAGGGGGGGGGFGPVGGGGGGGGGDAGAGHALTGSGDGGYRGRSAVAKTT